MPVPPGPAPLPADATRPPGARDGATPASEPTRRAERAEAELRRTRFELHALRAGLNPHFLFSSLHAVSALLGADAPRANRIVVNLAEVLRAALHGSGDRDRPLEEEVRALSPLLEIERARARDRLRIEWEVEEDALDARVPPLLLLSLAEYVIQHALPAPGADRELRVAARRDGEHLRLSVADPGAAFDPLESGPSAARRDLASIRTRLHQTYADRYLLERGPGASLSLSLAWCEDEGARAEDDLSAAPPAAAPTPAP